MAKYFKLIAENRKARFDYHILETVKAGIVLSGSEVKSLRTGKVNLKDSFARVEKGEVWIYGMHISPYMAAGASKTNPTRPRKILLKKKEIVKFVGKASEKGLTIVPLRLYFEGNWAKVELALSRAKRKYEKREKIRRREAEREIEKVFKGKNYGRENRR